MWDGPVVGYLGRDTQLRPKKFIEVFEARENLFKHRFLQIDPRLYETRLSVKASPLGDVDRIEYCTRNYFPILGQLRFW
jgi:hypothetical protein